MQSLKRAQARTTGLRETARVCEVKTLNDGFHRDSQSLKRRVARIRRAGMLEEASQLAICQATTADELAQAYALVHDVFVYQGYIAAQRGGIRVRAFEALPETATFVAKDGDRVVTVMSVVPDSQDLGLPSDKAFANELNALRLQGRRIAEGTNLAIAAEHRNSGAFFSILRLIATYSLTSGLDDLFVSISPGHNMFLESVLGFEPWGSRRDYGNDEPDYVEGMRLNLREFEQRITMLDRLLGEDAFLHQWFFEENPHFRSNLESTQIAQREFLKLNLLEELFIERSDFLSSCSLKELSALRRRWGGQTVNALLTRVRSTNAQTAA